jgi:hypothetical protein
MTTRQLILQPNPNSSIDLIDSVAFGQTLRHLVDDRTFIDVGNQLKLLCDFRQACACATPERVPPEPTAQTKAETSPPV